MRSLLRLVLPALVLAAAPVRAQTESARQVVAQLAATPGARAAPAAARPATERPAAPDLAAIARATPALQAMGLSIRRALLAGLPPPRGPAPRADAVTPLAGLALDRVVLIEAADSARADAARLALVEAGLADWAEPLRVRSLEATSLGHAGSARAMSPAALALLDTLPDDPLLRSGYQWGLLNVGPGGHYAGVLRADVHAIEGWRASVGSDAVRLAVADTGIDPSHPELGGLMADGSTRIVDGLNVTDEPLPAWDDSLGHGTLAAGVMAARTNDGPHFNSGTAGVCGGDGVTTAGCRIVPIKIAPGHSGEASSFDIARAIVHATDTGARAMNISFGGPGSSRLERLALTYAITHGCVVVAAAGNNNSAEPVYPAAYAADGLCIQVGASDVFDQRALFSSYGPGLDLIAPGKDIWSTFLTYPSWYGVSFPGYADPSGTSFAAPHVAGAVGLLAAVRPEMIDTDFQHVLRESADDVGAPGIDTETAWGRLDLGRALDAVRPSMGFWHDEVAADSVVADTTSGVLAIGERGPGTLDRWSGQVPARRFAAFATVTLPDSFVDSIRVWPRVGGTLAARGDYRLPYFTPTAQVIALGAHAFTLRGWLYRADEDGCATCPEPWIPLPPEYVRFGFTVLGKVSRGAPLPVPREGARAGVLAAGPSPFRGALSLRAPAAGRVIVLDAGGRVVRTFAIGAGESRWDGRDDAGRDVPPGLYFVRWQGAGAPRTARAVKLGP